MAYDEGALSRAHHYLHMEGREQLTVAGVRTWTALTKPAS